MCAVSSGSLALINDFHVGREVYFDRFPVIFKVKLERRQSEVKGLVPSLNWKDNFEINIKRRVKREMWSLDIGSVTSKDLVFVRLYGTKSSVTLIRFSSPWLSSECMNARSNLYVPRYV